ncbi:MAG TPA: hypothetical protein VFI84_02190 [Candidatus Saccharimonadales bacterium]|nr:hypothetical protein [Candidatus Saccharimonadales bacterium]
MSEQCMLRAYLGESNQETAWERDIPRECRNCIQAELDKPFVLLNIQEFGIREPSLNTISKLYRIGLEGKESLQGRQIVIEKLGTMAASATKKRTYWPFHCSRQVSLPAHPLTLPKAVNDVKPSDEYL